MRYLLVLIFCSVSLFSYAQLNMDLRDYLPYNDDLNDVWGYADTTGEYALVGLTTGVSIVDVTNPDTIVELHTVQGSFSTWRDLKTWNKHAYIVNETGQGLLIIDLSMLPDSISSENVQLDSAINTAHNIYIDENGFAYLFGYNDVGGSIATDDRGALILDLNNDPKVPVVVGKYDREYLHDGVVRGDTLWGSELYAGNFAAIDVTDKTNPIVLGQAETPNLFTHNCWISDDNNYLYTTDERAGAFVTAFDVSDLDNITEVDRIQSSPGANVIPHNVHVLGDYLVTSYYVDGLNIIDATEPDKLVIVGNYDTSPIGPSDLFSGCWGAYPYLPSGNILASDSEEGLFVFTPTYVRAAYLEGNVIYSDNTGPIANTKVEIIGFNDTRTDFFGDYSTGVPGTGMYDVRFSGNGCGTKLFTNISLTAGSTATLDATLDNCTAIVGIDDFENTEVELYTSASLFSGSTTVYYDIPSSGFSPAALTIIDMKGSIIKDLPINQARGEVILNNLASGMYLVQLKGDGFQKTLKLVRS